MSLAIPVLIATLTAVQPVDLTPYFEQDELLMNAYTLFKEGQQAAAADTLRTILATEKQGPRRVALLLLYSRTLKSGPLKTELLEELATLPAVAALAHYELGLNALKAAKNESALSHFSAIPKAGIYGIEAQIRMARIHRAKKRSKQALQLLEETLLLNPTRSKHAQIQLLKASLLQGLGRRSEAVTILRQLWFDRRGSPLAARVAKRLRRLKSTVSTAEQVAAQFFGARKAKRSTLRRLYKRAKKRQRRAGRHAFDLAKGVLYGLAAKKYRRAVYRFRRASKSRIKQVRGYAYYLWAEALEKMDQPKKAAELYLKIAHSLKGHPLAAEAMAQAASTAVLSKKQLDTLDKAFMARFPAHRRHLEHLWQRSFSAFKEEQWERACVGFERIAKRAGQSKHLRRHYWAERGQYWLGRCLWQAAQKEQAIKVWRDGVGRYPLSYYSHMAYNRLREHAPKEAEKMRTKALGVSYSVASIVSLSELSVVAAPDLELAVVLTRIGLFGLAKRELEARTRIQRLGPGAQTLLASLDLRKNHNARLNKLGRWFGTLPGQFTAPESRLWKLAFPLPYWALVQRNSGQFELSPWLVMAVIRHESSYRATAVSRAGATGLMQLMPRTAASVARRLLDIKAPSRKTLKEPQLNISLGTRLLKELMSLFHGNEALVLAAYNAGSGSARRWLKKHWARQQQHTDIFVEEIPAAETHAYVKAVLGSYGAYQFLYGEPNDKAFLSIPLEVHLPTTLGPYFRPKKR